jgi:hypothetical protein
MAIEDILITHFRTNIGLNLKFNKKNEEVAGFTKKVGINLILIESAGERKKPRQFDDNYSNLLIRIGFLCDWLPEPHCECTP